MTTSLYKKLDKERYYGSRCSQQLQEELHDPMPRFCACADPVTYGSMMLVFRGYILT